MIKKSKKKQTHQKTLNGGSLDANRINLPPTSRDRDIRILTASEAEDLRGESAELRVQIAGLHEETADLRQQTASLRKKATDLHEKTTSLREKALRAQNAKKKIAKEKAALNTHNESLLREANERLVVATINAQTMTETAEKATVQMSYMA